MIASYRIRQQSLFVFYPLKLLPDTIAREPIVIRHYMGHYEKPWCNVAWNRTWPPYLRFLLRTPWRGEAVRFVLGHLWGLVWSVQTKNGHTRAFLFGLRVFKRAARRPSQTKESLP